MMVKVRRVPRPPPRLNWRYSVEATQEPPNESYGHKMRRLRLALGLSQGDVAAMAGCSEVTIGLWERGVRHGTTPEAAELPRRAIRLLSERLRRRTNGQ